MFIEYRLADGHIALVEVSEEVAEYLRENERLTGNADRRERYHAPYSTDALLYEGLDYADKDMPEEIYLDYEEEEENGTDEERMREYLSLLTDVQRRRTLKRMEHMDFMDIAEQEGVDESSVRESVYGAYKRLRKKYPEKFSRNTPSKRTFFSVYGRDKKSSRKGGKKKCTKGYPKN